MSGIKFLLKIVLFVALLRNFQYGEAQCARNIYQSTSNYLIDGDSKYIEVECDQKIDDGLWTVVMSRFNGKVHFHNRTKEEYKHGFGNYKNSEYFIGLDAFSALTNDRPMELLFEVTYTTNETRYIKYSEFRFGYSSVEYAVRSTLGKYEGTDFRYNGGFADLLFCKFNYESTSLSTNVGWRKSDTGYCWHSNIFGRYSSNVFNPSLDLCWGPSSYCLQVKKLRMLIRPLNPYIKADMKN